MMSRFVMMRKSLCSVAALCVAAVTVGVIPVLPSASVVAAAPPAGASAYTPISPVRLADTRADYGSYGFTRLSDDVIRVQVAGREGIPANATAAALNVISEGAMTKGFATVYPSGTPIPGTSTLNIDVPGRTIANLTTVQLGADGSVEIYANTSMNLIVDVAGAYTPVGAATSAGRLVTIAGGASRVLDTRETGGPVASLATKYVSLAGLGVPADATAVVVNLVAVDAAVGYWTAFPEGETRPTASNLNIDEPLQTRSSQAIVRMPRGANGFQVFSQTGGNLVVDVAGWFTGASAVKSTDGLFVPTNPIRVLDTRAASGMPPWGNSTFEFSSGTPFEGQTAAAAMNITITDPLYRGFITAYPAGVERPFVSNLNVTSFDQIIANHAIVRLGTRGAAVFTQSGTHMVVDVTGWYLGTPDTSTLPVPQNPSLEPSYALNIAAPAAGLRTGVGYGSNITAVINTGKAGLWGSGTGGMGTPEHNVVFAHRTSHGGPFRYINNLTIGQTFTVQGADGRNYLYMVTRNDVIPPRVSALNSLLADAGPATFTLVACHPPGSVTYRLAITGRLIGLAP
jgi:hypothetical protein